MDQIDGWGFWELTVDGQTQCLQDFPNAYAPDTEP
jgi:hypothetical protein